MSHFVCINSKENYYKKIDLYINQMRGYKPKISLINKKYCYRELSYNKC